MRGYRLCGLAVLVAGAVTAAAADGVPGPVRAYVSADERYNKGNTRNRTDKIHDFVTDAGPNPTVAVFAKAVPNAADAPLAKLVARLDRLAVDHRGDRFGAFVLFQTLDKEYPEATARAERAEETRKLFAQLKAEKVANEKRVRAAQPNAGGEPDADSEAVRFLVPFGLVATKPEAAEAWKLADANEVTVVFFNRGMEVSRWAFTADKPLTDDDGLKVEEAVKAELKKK